MPIPMLITDVSADGFNIGMPPSLTWSLDRQNATRAEFTALDGDTTWTLRARFTQDGGTLNVSDVEVGTSTDGGAYARQFTLSYEKIEWTVIATDLVAFPDALTTAFATDFNAILAPASTQTRFDGTDNRDRLFGGGENDVLLGGEAADRLNGGRGDDALSGGVDNDRIKGGAGHDLILTGEGRNIADGGRGNDIIGLSGDFDRATGGAGSDVFALDKSSTKGLNAVVRDFDPLSDILIFTESEFTIGGEAIPSDARTIADLPASLLDGLQIRDTSKGLTLRDGDTKVRLNGVTSDDLLLENLFFNDTSLEDLVSSLDASTPSLIGTTFGGDVRGGDGYLIITMENVVGRQFDTLDASDLYWWGDPLELF